MATDSRLDTAKKLADKLGVVIDKQLSENDGASVTTVNDKETVDSVVEHVTNYAVEIDGWSYDVTIYVTRFGQAAKQV